MSRFVFFSSIEAGVEAKKLWAGAAALLADSGHSVTIFKPVLTRITRGFVSCSRWVVGFETYARWACPPGFVCPSRWPGWRSRWSGYQEEYRAGKRFGPLVRAHLAHLNPDLVLVCQGVTSTVLPTAIFVVLPAAHTPSFHRKRPIISGRSGKDRSLMRSALQSALRCYFVSQHNLQLTECQIGESLMNAEIVRNPFLVSGSPLPWPENKDNTIKLACVARLETDEKGQDIILRVLARPQWKNRNVVRFIFGAGHHGEALRELARHLGL